MQIIHSVIYEKSNFALLTTFNSQIGITGFWSRRINKKDRIVYQVIEEPDRLVVIVSALGYY